MIPDDCDLGPPQLSRPEALKAACDMALGYPPDNEHSLTLLFGVLTGDDVNIIIENGDERTADYSFPGHVWRQAMADAVQAKWSDL